MRICMSDCVTDWIIPTLWLDKLSAPLHFVACSLNRKTLVVQQRTDMPDHQDLVMLVITSVAATFHGTQLCELLLPVTQHVGFNTA